MSASPSPGFCTKNIRYSFPRGRKGERIYGSESWTVKKAECLRIDAFELWCWRRLLRVPWTARSMQETPVQFLDQEVPLEKG